MSHSSGPLHSEAQAFLGYEPRIEAIVVWDAEAVLACRGPSDQQLSILVVDTETHAILDCKTLQDVDQNTAVRLQLLSRCLVINVGLRVYFVTRAAGDGVFNVHGIGGNAWEKSHCKKGVVRMEETCMKRVEAEDGRAVVECDVSAVELSEKITFSLSVNQLRRLTEELQKKQVHEFLVVSMLLQFMNFEDLDPDGGDCISLAFGVGKVTMTFREERTIGDLKRHVQKLLNGVPSLDCIQCHTGLSRVKLHDDSMKLTDLPEDPCIISFDAPIPVRNLPFERLKRSLIDALEEANTETMETLKSNTWRHVEVDLDAHGLETLLQELCKVLGKEKHDSWSCGIVMSLYEQLCATIGYDFESYSIHSKSNIESLRHYTLASLSETTDIDGLAMLGFAATHTFAYHRDYIFCTSCKLHITPYPTLFNIVSYHKKHKNNCTFTPFGYAENVPLSVTYAAQQGPSVEWPIAHIVEPVNDDKDVVIAGAHGACAEFKLSSRIRKLESRTEVNGLTGIDGEKSRLEAMACFLTTNHRRKEPKRRQLVGVVRDENSYILKATSCSNALNIGEAGEVFGMTAYPSLDGHNFTIALLHSFRTQPSITLYNYLIDKDLDESGSIKGVLQESSVIDLVEPQDACQGPLQLLNCHGLDMLLVVYRKGGMHIVNTQSVASPEFLPYDHGDETVIWARYSKRTSQVCVVLKDYSVVCYDMLKTLHLSRWTFATGFRIDNEINKMRQSLEFELLPFNTYSNIGYPLKTSGMNTKWSIAGGSGSPTFVLEFFTPTVVSALHFSCSGVFHLGKAETFERELVLLVEGKVYRTVRVKAEELSRGSGTKRFMVKQTMKTFPLVVQKQSIEIQVRDLQKDRITEGKYALQIKAFGCRNYFSDAHEMMHIMLDDEQFQQYLLLVSAVPHGTRMNTPEVFQAKGFEASRIVDAKFQVSCTELLVALLKCGQSLKQLRSKVRAWLLNTMVKDDDKPVVHYMLLNSVLGTEQRSSYVTAQLLTQCVNPTFKRHLLLCIVGLIPVAVGLSSTERLPSSLRSASLPPLCGAPNPAGLRTIFELLCSCSSKASDAETIHMLQETLAAIGSKLHELQARNHVQAYDALRTRLDLYRSVLETYTYEVESFYTSVKKAISEPVPQVFVLKKGRDLFFRSEKTPLFLCVKEISPGSSIQQQLPEQTSPETNNPAPLGSAAASAVGDALSSSKPGESAALLSYTDHDCEDPGSCETCKGQKVALEDYGIKVSGCGKQVQLQWSCEPSVEADDSMPKTLCYSVVLDLGTTSVVQQLNVSLQINCSSHHFKNAPGDYYASCWAIQDNGVVAHTLSEEELERQVGVSTLFEMSLMTTDADRWKNKPSKLTSADQARVEKALKQADLLLQKNLGLSGHVLSNAKKASSKTQLKHAPILRVLNKQNLGAECRFLLVKVFHEPSHGSPPSDSVSGRSTLGAFGIRGGMEGILDSEQVEKQLKEAERYEGRIADVFASSVQLLERDLHETILRDDLVALPAMGKSDYKSISNVYEKCGILQAGRTITARRIYSLKRQLAMVQGQPAQNSSRWQMEAFPFTLEETAMLPTTDASSWPVCSLGRLKLAGKLIARHIHKFSHPSSAERVLVRGPKMDYFDWLELFANLCLYGPSRSLRKAVVRLFSPSISKLPAFVADALSLYVSTNVHFMHTPKRTKATHVQQRLDKAVSLEEATNCIVNARKPLDDSKDRLGKAFTLSPVLNVLEECICGDKPAVPKKRVAESLCMFLRELWQDELCAAQNIIIWTLLLLSKLWRDTSSGGSLRECPTEHYLAILNAPNPKNRSADLVFLKLIRHFPGEKTDGLLARSQALADSESAEAAVREAAQSAIDALNLLAKTRQTFCLDTMLEMVVRSLARARSPLSKELQVLSLNTLMDCMLYFPATNVYTWINSLEKHVLVSLAREGLTSSHADVREGTLQCFILLSDLNRAQKRPLDRAVKKTVRGKLGEDTVLLPSRERLIDEVKSKGKAPASPNVTQATRVVVSIACSLLKEESVPSGITPKYLLLMLLRVLPVASTADFIDASTVRTMTSLLRNATETPLLDTAYASICIRALVRCKSVVPPSCRPDLLSVLLSALAASCTDDTLSEVADDLGSLLTMLLALEDSNEAEMIDAVLASLAELCQRRGESFIVAQTVVERLQEFVLATDELPLLQVSALLHAVLPWVRGIQRQPAEERSGQAFVTPVSSPLEDVNVRKDEDVGSKGKDTSMGGSIISIRSFAVEALYLVRLVVRRNNQDDVLKAIDVGAIDLLLDILHRSPTGVEEAAPSRGEPLPKRTSEFCELINSSRDLPEYDWKVKLQTLKLGLSAGRHSKSPLTCVLSILQCIADSSEGDKVLLELCMNKLHDCLTPAGALPQAHIRNWNPNTSMWRTATATADPKAIIEVVKSVIRSKDTSLLLASDPRWFQTLLSLLHRTCDDSDVHTGLISHGVGSDIRSSQGGAGVESGWLQPEKEVFLSEADILRNGLPENQFTALERLLRISSTMQNGVRSVLPHPFKEIPHGSIASTKEFFIVDLILKRPFQVTELFVECTTSISNAGVPSTRLPAEASIFLGSTPDDLTHIDTRRFVIDAVDHPTGASRAYNPFKNKLGRVHVKLVPKQKCQYIRFKFVRPADVVSPDAAGEIYVPFPGSCVLLISRLAVKGVAHSPYTQSELKPTQAWSSAARLQVMSLLLHVNRYTPLASLENPLDAPQLFKILLQVVSQADDANTRSTAMKLFALNDLWADMDAISITGKHLLMLTYKADTVLASTSSTGYTSRSCVEALEKAQQKLITAICLITRVLCFFCTDSAGIAKVVPWAVKNLSQDVESVTARMVLWTAVAKSLTHTLFVVDRPAQVAGEDAIKMFKLIQDSSVWEATKNFTNYVAGTAVAGTMLELMSKRWAQSRTHLRLVWLKFLCAIVRREPEIYSLLHDENVGSEPNWSCLVTGEADWAAQTLRLLGVIGAACKDESLYSRKSALVEAVLQRLEALPIREEAVHLVGYLADAFLDEGLVEHWVEPNFSLVLDAAFATLASHSASSTVALRWLDALRATIAFPKMLEALSLRILQELEEDEQELSGHAVEFCVGLLQLEHRLYIHLHPTVSGSKRSHIFAWQEEALGRFVRDSHGLGAATREKDEGRAYGLATELDTVLISNDGMSAKHVGSVTEMVLLRPGISQSSGVVSWKVLVEDLADETLTVGITLEESELGGWPGKGEQSWSLSSCGSKWHKGDPFKYTKPVKRGDVVQVVLNLSKQQLSFGINGIDCGLAFDNIPKPTSDRPIYPAFAFFGPGQAFHLVESLHFSKEEEEPETLLSVPLFSLLRNLTLDASEFPPPIEMADIGMIRRLQKRKELVSECKSAFLLQEGKQGRWAARANPESLKLLASLVKKPESSAAPPRCSKVSELDCLTSASRVEDRQDPLENDSTKLWLYRPGPVVAVSKEVTFGTLACDLAEAGVLNDEMVRRLEVTALEDSSWECCPCTYSYTQKVFVEQDWFHCEDCNLVGNNGCCAICAIKCHKGHNVKYRTRSAFYCDCALSNTCRGLQDCHISCDFVARTGSLAVSPDSKVVDVPGIQADRGILDIAFQLESDNTYLAASEDASADVSLSYRAGRYPVVSATMSQEEGLSAIILVLEQIISSKVALVLSLKDEAGRGRARQVFSSMLKGKEQNIGDWRKWLSFLQVLRSVPGFSAGFSANVDCVAIVVSLLQTCDDPYHGYSIVTDELFKLYQDPCKPMIEVIKSLLERDADSSSGARPISSELLAQGVLDLLLVRIGDLEGEAPKDTERTKKLRRIVEDKYKFPDSQSTDESSTTSSTKGDAKETAAKDDDSLWKPGFGYGHADNPEEDAERAQRFDTWRSRSMETLECVLRIVEAEVEAGRSEALIAEVLESSCLLNLIHSYFFGNSVKSLLENQRMNHCLLRLCMICTKVPDLRVLLQHRPGQYSSVFKLLQDLQVLATDILELQAEEVYIDKTSGEEPTSQRTSDQVNSERDFAIFIQQVFRAVEEIVKVEQLDKDGASLSADRPNGEVENFQVRYEREMKELQFGSMDFANDKGVYKHTYWHNLANEAQSSSRAKRLNRELRGFKNTLPIHFGSTIVIRVDSVRPHVMRAAIFAPQNTPYDSGCFLFDIYLPPDYPNIPPMITLITTGNGMVRFNPNLYNSGKVCLSLLGTWRGGATGNENWTKKSTLLQVLVSIQSLILGAEYPYFNEPGVEAMWGTPEGELQKRINSNGGYESLRCATITHAMVQHLVNPPVGFEDVVKMHFKLKSDYILAMVESWLDDAKSSDTPGYHSNLSKACAKLRANLEKL